MDENQVLVNLETSSFMLNGCLNKAIVLMIRNKNDNLESVAFFLKNIVVCFLEAEMP